MYFRILNFCTTMRITLSVLALLLLSFASCKKDDSAQQVHTTPDSTQQSRELKFQFSHTCGNVALTSGTVYHDSTGRAFSLSDLRYYISNIVLIKNDGSVLPLTGKVLLVNMQQNEYSLGTIAEGDYSGLHFMIGLDSVTNHSDPTLYPASSPLSYQPVSMHWDWNYGYIFMKAEGAVDTSFVPTGNLSGILSYHIGSDELARVLNFPNHSFTVKENTSTLIKLQFDFLKMLSGVDLQSENITHTFPRADVTVKLVDNWQPAMTIVP